VQADATDPETLRRLGVRDFDGAVVAIGESLESSILTTMALRELGVRHITAKAREERHGQILQRIGVDRIVYPERDTGERLAHSWSARSVTDSLSVVEEFAVHRVTVPDSFAGRTLAAADLHRRYHVSIFLLARGPKVTVHPGPDEVLRQGDVLVVAGNDDDVERLFT
jgi:trk system potassium uptake protein TrkA